MTDAVKTSREVGLVSGLTMLSRVLGLVREQVFAGLLGAGLYGDAFQIAYRVPNLLRDLFAEGALSAAFVPTYAKVLLNQGAPEAHRLANRLLSVLGLLLSGLTLLGMLGAPWIVHALAPGYAEIPGKTQVTILLTRIMLPFLPVVSFAAVAMGMLNARERYGPPAFAPAMFNLVTVSWGALLWLGGFNPFQVAMGWAVGTLLGGVAQFLIQMPPLRGEGWRFHGEWEPRDTGLREIGRLMAPATLGLAAVQINIFVGSHFASQEPGAVSWLQFAFRILYLPIGIFGVAVGTIAGVGLARRAALDDLVGMRDTLRRSLRVLAFLTLPASVGLIVLREPIVRLIFQHGRFGPADTAATAHALLYYSVGLIAYTSIKVLAPAFYAFGTPKVPVIGSAVAVTVNILMILSFYGRMGYVVVALGTALGAFANACVLGVVLEGRLGVVRGSRLPGAVARMALAAGAMAPVTLWVERLATAWLGTAGFVAHLGAGLLPVLAGVLAYVGFAWLLRVDELRMVLQAIRSRAG